MAQIDKLLQQLQAHLEPGETVVDTVKARWELRGWGEEGTRTGILAATDRRLVLYAKKLIGEDVRSFPWESVSSFETGKKLRMPFVKFTAEKKSFYLKWAESDDLAKFAEAVQSRTAGTS